VTSDCVLAGTEVSGKCKQVEEKLSEKRRKNKFLDTSSIKILKLVSQFNTSKLSSLSLSLTRSSHYASRVDFFVIFGPELRNN
jgi:hypothetical protein